MAQCVVVGAGGVIEVSSSPPDLTCTGYVLMSQAEFVATQGLFELSVADGQAIGWAVFVLWAVAYGWRVLRKVLDVADPIERE